MLKLTKQIASDTIKIGEEEITVYGTIGSYEKVGIIAAALEQSAIGGVYNRLIFDAVFYASIVVKYTNIEIADMATMKIVDLHDLLEQNDIIPAVLNAIDSINKNEIKEFSQYADTIYQEAMDNANSPATTVQMLLVGLSQLIEESDGKTKRTISKLVKEEKEKREQDIKKVSDKN